ncbi:MAG: uncharacterized protein K0R29_2597 [Pseudobdellovibrio sp.]|jgi:SAM-dependent methyltransferase|nr:uncharacterized protein [Pseudobdellovibrio sp.]
MFKTLKARAGDFRKVLHMNGWLGTLKIIYSTFADINFDRTIGIKTDESKTVEGKFEYDGELHKGSLYVPTRGRPLLEFLSQMNFPKRYTFVDLGCGRGRVLWLAKQFGFAKVVGIEIDKDLAVDATANMQRKILVEGRDFEVHHMNAGDYRPSSNENIYFFYGPYMSDSDLQSALEKLHAKKVETGCEQFIVYHCNIKPTGLLDRIGLVKVSDEKFSGNRFMVYKFLMLLMAAAEDLTVARNSTFSSQIEMAMSNIF